MLIPPQSFQINITNLNDSLPEITSSSSFSALENQTDIGTVEASDADGESLTNFDFKISQLMILQLMLQLSFIIY